MLRLASAALLASGLSSAAFADGLPERYAPTPFYLYNWSGLYIGAHVGWEWGDVGGTTCDPLNTAFSTICSSFAVAEQYRQNINGWLGGGQIGVNHQIGRAVLGLELSGSWDDVSGSKSHTITTSFFPPHPAACLNPHTTFSNLGTTINCHANQDWTTQVLAKFGYALADGRVLPYITGGVALTELRTKTSEIVSPGASFQQTFDWGAQKTLMGGVMGGGLQYAVGGGVSLGVEYLYTQYAGRDFSNVASCSSPGFVCPPLAGISPNPENHDLSTQTVRLVVNYKFGERDLGPLK